MMDPHVDQDPAPRSRPDEYPGTELGTEKAQIRILEVLPGEGDSPIRCHLQSVHFNAIREADALSYTWGLPPAANTIFVNDVPFRIRDNLFNALVHLRQPYSGVLLWIDAICINQSDMKERNHQVQQMADVFGRARRVLIWLGAETENTRAAFSFLSQAYLRSPYNRKELMDDPRWAVLKELCQIDYWRRVWIVQEICLAARAVICCGRQQIPWKYIFELRKSREHIWPQYQSAGERDFMRSLPARLDQQKEARLSGDCVLWTLLESFQDSLCQEVHDRIYGFMGLSTDCGGQGLAIDYTKSVEELYRDVICFYHDKFRRDSSSHHAPQLMKLSEFLQILLGNHSKADLNPSSVQQRRLWDPNIEPVPSTFVSISACNLILIVRFPYANHEDSIRYRLAELIDYLDGKLPYSHLGYWRDLVESDSKRVSTINDSEAYAIVKFIDDPPSFPVQKIDRPSVFIGLHITNFNDQDNLPYVVGIAPCGSQTGDVVLSFIGSQVSLVMRGPQPEFSTLHKMENSLKDHKYVLAGTGCVFPTHIKTSLPFQCKLTADKKVEIVKSTSLRSEPDPPVYFPAILSMDLSTLQLVTTPNIRHLSSGFNKPTLNLFPSESSETGRVKDIYAHKLRKPVDDSELQMMQQDPEMKRYALGPGYTAITNPGSIGYVTSSLQILYMLKPFRTTVLRSEDDPDWSLTSELRKLFWKLHTSHLPVNPLGVTNTFGWGTKEINEVQDFSEFWRMFIARVEDTSIGRDSISFLIGGIRTLYKETGAARNEAIYHMELNACNIPRLEDSFEDYFTPWGENQLQLSLTQVPDVLILCGKFFYYDMDKDKMETDTETFEYPSEIDLGKYTEPGISDTLYQLHGVVVLEDVKPVSRHLLYLRPNIEDQWILFFKETVSYAQRSEVFEDNFRLDNEKTRNAPLRTPYIFVYILKSKLDEYLG